MNPAHRNAHLNLIESSRRLFGLDPGVELEEGDGWLFGAGRATHPAISNAAFRSDDDVDATKLVDRALEFFGERGRGFSVWVRGEEPEDRDLAAAAEARGLRQVHASPEMIVTAPVETRPLPAGAEVRRLASDDDAEDFWRIAESSYAEIGFPPEVFAFYENHEVLWEGGAATFIAYLDGGPAAIAMTIVSHDVAGIYWVGTLEAARGNGLAWAATAAATNAGFELGAKIASLQASRMGEPMYRKMGYEAIYDYRLLMASPPEAP